MKRNLNSGLLSGGPQALRAVAPMPAESQARGQMGVAPAVSLTVSKTGEGTDKATPVLFHGTTRRCAQQIIAGGFKRADAASYTGTGVCLSESISVAHPYGTPEEGGAVLEVRLMPGIRWQQFGNETPIGGHDRIFRENDVDALRTFSGNVWILWSVEKVASLRVITHKEVMHRLIEEFEIDGPECGYNGLAAQYAAIWWEDIRYLSTQRVSAEDIAIGRKRLRRHIGFSTHAEMLAKANRLIEA